MSRALRAVAMDMLSQAHQQRNAAEYRLWQARDEQTRLRLLYLEAQQAVAIAQRDFDRAQEFLTMVWEDLNPRHLSEKPTELAASEPVEATR